MHPITFVFDIDDTLALHFGPASWEKGTREVADLYGEEFVERHKVMACGYPHFVFPGAPGLWRWLEAQGHRLAMFSSAVKERNLEFARGFVELAFGDRAAEVLPAVKILSREDCTCATNRDEDEKRYQLRRFRGNYKKVLSGVAVPPEELPWTLLIDDDPSYMPRTEIFNYVHAETGYRLSPAPCRENDKLYWGFDDFAYFYKAFYLAGLFRAISGMIASGAGTTAAMAAKALQIDCRGKKVEEGAKEPFGDDFRYETYRDMRYYLEGEKILRGVDPGTKIPVEALRYVPQKYPLPEEWGVTQTPGIES